MKTIQELKTKLNAAKREAREELFWQSIPRKVAPAVIEEFPTHLRINYETLVKCVLVGVPHLKVEGYPRELNPRMMDELLNITAPGYTIGFSFTAIPIQTAEAMQMLDHALFYNKVNQDDTTKHNNGLPSMKLTLDAEDFSTNYRQLHQSQLKMYHSAFICVIWAKNEDELRKAESHIRTVFEANIVHYEFPYRRMLEIFVAAQPYPTSSDCAWVELFSHHVAMLSATRNPNSRTSATGLYFGDDFKTGKNVLVDLKALAAQHLMFVGPTGSGKTFTLLMLLMRAYDMLGKRIIYTTPKADVTTNYRAVAAYYGDRASIIDIGPQGKNINPLQIMLDENIMTNQHAYLRAFDEHMELVDQFFSVLFEGTKTINMSNYLNESLIECYKRKGIVRENPASWKNTEFPTLLDLRDVWIEDAKDPSNVTAKALVDKTFMVNTAWAYMNRATDINLSADFIVIDISDVPASLQDAMNVFVCGIMGMRFRTDAKKETIIATDEAAVFLRNPKLSLFLLRTLTQGRSAGISLWLATQQTADLVKAGVSEEFKTNMQISIVLGNMRKDTLEHVRSFYRLNDTDVNNLMSCGVGEGLLLVGNEVVPVKFRPTQHEMDVIKGKYGKKPVGKPVTDSGFKLVHESLNGLAAQHGIYFDNWIDGDANQLANMGFEPHVVQCAVSRGTQRAWIKSSKIIDDKIGFHSIDHDATVLQIAGHLCQAGIAPIINQDDDVDLSFQVNGEAVAFEYERPGSHDVSKLLQKKQYAESKYSKVYFIGTAENVKQLSDAVGSACVVRRGAQLVELLQDLIEQTTMQESAGMEVR